MLFMFIISFRGALVCSLLHDAFSCTFLYCSSNWLYGCFDSVL